MITDSVVVDISIDIDIGSESKLQSPSPTDWHWNDDQNTKHVEPQHEVDDDNISQNESVSVSQSLLTLVLLYVTGAVVVAIFCATLLYLAVTRTSKHFEEISSLFWVRDPPHFSNSKQYEKVRAHSEDPDKYKMDKFEVEAVDQGIESVIDLNLSNQSRSESAYSVITTHSMPPTMERKRPYIVGTTSNIDDDEQQNNDNRHDLQLWTKGYINVIAADHDIDHEVNAKEATHSETEEKQFMINQCSKTKEEQLIAMNMQSLHGEDEQFAAITTFSGEHYHYPTNHDQRAISSESTCTATMTMNRLNVEMTYHLNLNLENHITGMTGQSSSHLDEQVMAKPEYQHSETQEYQQQRFISLEDLVMSTQTCSPSL